MSDTGNIDAFIKLYGDITRYTVERGFFHWNDQYWEVDTAIRRNGAGKWTFLKARALAMFFEKDYALQVQDDDLQEAWLNWGIKSGNAARLDAVHQPILVDKGLAPVRIIEFGDFAEAVGKVHKPIGSQFNGAHDLLGSGKG